MSRIVAWGIHGYTALGGVIGLFALYAASQGSYASAFLLLLATVVIDGTDGLMARRAKVKLVLPHFDGAQVDNVIDFLTYVWIPAFIMWHASLLPHPALTVIPVIAALYAYGQTNMKSADGYFTGFPSYWNFIALYLYWLRPEPVIAAAMVIVPGVLSFIPTRYLYPSRGGPLWRTTWTLMALWAALVVYIVVQPIPPHELVMLSLFGPIYYMGGSFYAELRARRLLPRERAV